MFDLEDLLGERGWLFVFPNMFEYFFIFYESVRLFWDPRRLSDRLLIGAAAPDDQEPRLAKPLHALAHVGQGHRFQPAIDRVEHRERCKPG